MMDICQVSLCCIDDVRGGSLVGTWVNNFVRLSVCSHLPHRDK